MANIIGKKLKAKEPTYLVRQLEASASQAHFKKLQEDKSTWAESGDIFQRVLRDYRRVHHHIAAIAYPVIDRLGDKSAPINPSARSY